MKVEYRINLLSFRIFAFIFTVLSVVLGYFFLLSYTAEAQEFVGVTIIPALIEDRVENGESYPYSLEVTNLSTKKEEYFIFARNVQGLTPDGQPVFADFEEKTSFELASWIKIEKDTLILEEGESAEVLFSIEVPKSTSPGGHFAAIFLSTKPEAPEGEAGAGVGYEVGTLLNFQVEGTISEELRLREFSTDRFIYWEPKVDFITRAENFGNVLLRPRGPIEITNFFNKKVETLAVNESGGALFPGQIREFEASWNPEGFTFGRYQALAGLVYGNEAKKNVYSIISFWVLPLNIILPVFLTIIFLFLSVYFSVRFYIKFKLKKLYADTQNIHGKQKEGIMSLENLEIKMPFASFLWISAIMFILSLILLFILFFFFG